MRGVFLDLLPQLVYHHAKVFRFLAVIRPPDRLQQSLMSKRISFLHNKSAQDVKFLGSQVDSLPAHVHAPFLEIDAQFWSLNFGEMLSRAGASQCSSNAGEQFSDCERFYNVIIRPGKSTSIWSVDYSELNIVYGEGNFSRPRRLQARETSREMCPERDP